MKRRQSVRKELESLIRWVNFVNNESAPPPKPDFYVSDEVREFACMILRRIPEVRTRENKAKLFSRGGPRSYEFELPARCETLQVSLNTVSTWNVSVSICGRWDPVRDSLLPALTQKIGPVIRDVIDDGRRKTPCFLQEEAGDRLRICKCGKLFVALNTRAEYCDLGCSNRLRQREFYKLNTVEQRKIKLKRYHVNRIRSAVAQQSRIARAGSRRLGNDHSDGK